jgi:hypothetical protein
MSVRLPGLLVCAFVVLLGFASPASADWWEDIIAYLQGMSGPGPYNGYVLSAELACFGRDRNQAGPCRSRESVRAYIVLEKGWWNDDIENPNFVGNTYIHAYQFITYFPIEKLRAVDLGAGFGLYRISGAAVQDPPLWRATIPLRVRVVPSEFFADKLTNHPKGRAWLSAFTYHIGWDWIPEGFSNTTFFGPPDYDPDDHALFTNAFTIDVVRFVDGLARSR